MFSLFKPLLWTICLCLYMFYLIKNVVLKVYEVEGEGVQEVFVHEGHATSKLQPRYRVRHYNRFFSLKRIRIRVAKNQPKSWKISIKNQPKSLEFRIPYIFSKLLNLCLLSYIFTYFPDFRSDPDPYQNETDPQHWL